MPSRIRTCGSVCGAGGVGEELAVDRVGDPAFEAAHGFHRFLAGGALAVGSRRGPRLSSRSWVTAAMWIMWFIRRFPARESRCRFCSPEEASRGAVPVQEANRLRSANRVDVADVGQDPGGDHGSDTGQVHQS